MYKHVSGVRTIPLGGLKERAQTKDKASSCFSGQVDEAMAKFGMKWRIVNQLWRSGRVS